MAHRRRIVVRRKVRRAPARLVTVEQLLGHLRRHRDLFPAALIAERSGLPRSIVYDALDGENITLKTLKKIVEVCGGQVVIHIRPGMSRLRP